MLVASPAHLGTRVGGDNVVYRDNPFHRVVVPMSGPLLSPTKLNGLHDEEGIDRA
jgi:hypothetical protein